MEMTYYTPSIEDLSFGYEYEQYIPGSEREGGIKRYNKRKIGDIHGIITTAFNAGLKDWIRVPRLTQEQIIAEGWTILSDISPFTGKPYKFIKCWDGFGFNEPHEAILEFHYPNIKITHEWESSWNHSKGTVFEGKSLSINEFRTIIKLLGI